MAGYDHPKLARYRSLVEQQTPDLDWLAARAAAIRPDDPAFIVYTSGTTGNPKGALVAHGKHLAAAATVADHYPTLYGKEHRTVVYLPLCHVLGRDVAATLPLFTRLVPHFGEDPDDLATTLFETAPTVLFTVPRYLQKFAAAGAGRDRQFVKGQAGELRTCDALRARSCPAALERRDGCRRGDRLPRVCRPPCSGRSSTSSASTSSSWW